MTGKELPQLQKNKNNKMPPPPPPFAGNDGVMLQWKMRNISHARMHIVTDMLSKYELHHTHPRILGTIQFRNGATQKELADEMNTSPAAMSVSIKRLQKAGLIEKISDESDCRINKIKLTEKGAHIHDDIFEKTIAIDRSMLDGFSEEEIAQLFLYLDRVQENIDKMRERETVQ